MLSKIETNEASAKIGFPQTSTFGFCETVKASFLRFLACPRSSTLVYT